MAKIIKYKFLSCEVNRGTVEMPDIAQIILDAEIVCSTKSVYDDNYPIAEREAIQGTIEVVGEFDPVAESTADEVLNAMLGVM